MFRRLFASITGLFGSHKGALSANMAPHAHETAAESLPGASVAARVDENVTAEKITEEKDARLKVIVVGAGIAGLSAAAGLRRAGHEVEIFEQSSFANEIGAAIHLPPNASRVLLEWGLDAEKSRLSVARSAVSARGDNLQPIYQAEFDNVETKYASPWYLSHRVDLHNALKWLATREDGVGTPVKIRLRTKVTNIDPTTATVTLNDSTIHKADIVVAADGVHSKAVQLVTGQDTPALPTGFSAFRFLIPTDVLLADPQTAHFLTNKDGQFKIFIGDAGRRLVWYPCRADTIQNFVGIHPDNQAAASVEAWNVSASTADVLAEYRAFHPDVIAAVAKASDVKLWKLLYREPIPAWHTQRLVLIGDAAHPMLPHQGQGGAQSIEDGAAIGVLLSRIPRAAAKDKDALDALLAQRLAGFEKVRRLRASLMQIYSNAGQDEPEKVRDEAVRFLGKGVHVPANPAEFQAINFGHDVVAESEKVLAAL